MIRVAVLLITLVCIPFSASNTCRIFDSKVTNLAIVQTFADTLRTSGALIIPPSIDVVPKDLGQTIIDNLLTRPRDPEAIITNNQMRARVALDRDLNPSWNRDRLTLVYGDRIPAGFAKEISLKTARLALRYVKSILEASVPTELKDKGHWMLDGDGVFLLLEFLPNRRPRWWYLPKKHPVDDEFQIFGVHKDGRTYRRSIIYLKGPGAYINTSGQPLQNFDRKKRFRKSQFQQAEEFGIAIISGGESSDLFRSFETEHSDPDTPDWRAAIRADWVWVPNE